MYSPLDVKALLKRHNQFDTLPKRCRLMKLVEMDPYHMNFLDVNLFKTNMYSLYLTIKLGYF